MLPQTFVRTPVEIPAFGTTEVRVPLPPELDFPPVAGDIGVGGVPPTWLAGVSIDGGDVVVRVEPRHHAGGSPEACEFPMDVLAGTGEAAVPLARYWLRTSKRGGVPW